MEPRSVSEGEATKDAVETAHPAEAFPFDRSARADLCRDLDRLRTVADRELARYMYDLFVLTERNSSTAASSAPLPRSPLESMRRAASRGLDGQLGQEARELAEALLLDDSGRQRLDDDLLRRYVRALQELRRC